MRKTLLVIVSLVFSLTMAAGNGFKISGTIEGLPEGSDIQLLPQSILSMKPLCSAKVEAGGKFTLVGETGEPLCVTLYGDKMYTASWFIVNGGDDLTITGKADVRLSPKFGEVVELKDVKVQGSPLTDKLLELKGEEGREVPRAELKEKVLANKDTFWGPILLMQLSPAVVTITQDQFNWLSDEAKKTFHGQAIREFVYPEEMPIGQVIKPFQVKGDDGKVSGILDLVKQGKYTLIDFWASWCVPCRQEMQNIKKYYATWHDSGFNVVSISIDRSEEAWKKASADENIKWPNYLDRMGAADAYKIIAVPALYIVDSEGKLLAHNLRGEELHKFIDGLFK